MSIKSQTETEDTIENSIETKIEFHQRFFEIKSIDDTNEEFFIISGYATKFFGLDTYNDRVIPGAYKETIEKNAGGFPAFFMHQSHEPPVGLFFKLFEDEVGLFVQARLPKSDDFVKNRLMPQMKTGSVNALSIGFRPTKVSFEDVEGVTVRILEGIDLREISFITKGYQADSGALLTDIKSKSENRTAEENIYNAMVETKRKGATDEVKKEIIEFYHEKGRKNPFDEDSVLSTEELSNLSKSNRAYAIRELQLSARASNNLARLMETPKSGHVNSLKSGTDNIDETQVEDTNPKSTETEETLSNDNEGGLKTAIGDLLAILNHSKETSNVRGKIC